MPFQPSRDLQFSLSAADVHVVSVDNAVVGICHPCKMYGAMAVGRPIFLVGPNPCYASEIMEGQAIGWHVQHGDVDGALEAIKAMVSLPREELATMGLNAQRLVNERFSRRLLLPRFCDVLEEGLRVPEMASFFFGARRLSFANALITLPTCRRNRDRFGSLG